jgi:hypothetical protein
MTRAVKERPVCVNEGNTYQLALASVVSLGKIGKWP